MNQDLAALLVESSPDALIALSLDNIVLYWSAGAEAILVIPRWKPSVMGYPS